MSTWSSVLSTRGSALSDTAWTGTLECPSRAVYVCVYPGHLSWGCSECLKLVYSHSSLVVLGLCCPLLFPLRVEAAPIVPHCPHCLKLIPSLHPARPPAQLGAALRSGVRTLEGASALHSASRGLALCLWLELEAVTLGRPFPSFRGPD